MTALTESSHTEEEHAYDRLTPQEEAALVEACTAGDSRAWRELVDTYGPRVYSALRYFLRAYRESFPEEDALNIYQEMFLDLCGNNFRKLKTFHGGGKLATWLFTVARRQCLDYVRASTRRKRIRPALTGPEVLDLGTPLSHRADPLAASENREAVLSALDRLDTRSRLLLVLFYFEDLSYEEIAKVIGISENSVSPMLRKAREDVGKILRE